MKKFHIDIIVNFTPSQKPTGFHDFITVKSDGEVIYSGMCSASPNGYHPRTRKPWWKHYGCVATSTQPIEITTHHKYGGCLLVNKGNAIPAINKNPNHNGNKIITDVFIHRALGIINKLWRGSAGCFTMPKSKIKKMIRSIRENGCGTSGTITIHHNGRLDFRLEER